MQNITGKILISTCLLGIKCRYDGKSKPCEKLISFLKGKDVIFYCPEQGGGLSTPREPAEIEYGKTAGDVIDGKGKIVSRVGIDVSREYLKGAYETLELCRKFGVEVVVLKTKSPSCGYGKVYDGSFTGKLIDGNGVTAELLERNGIKIFSENDFE